MTETDQQTETLHYFKKSAKDWQLKSSQSTEQYNFIQHRNATVLERISTHDHMIKFLDVGCGTGQLTIAAAKEPNLTATGIDFSSEMITICNENLVQSGLNAKFIHTSVFDFSAPPLTYDVISALGFIEYISLEEIELFLSRTNKWLNIGGSLMLGSRNRLFNLFSLNEYTSLEISAGTINSLLKECICLNNANNNTITFEELAKALSLNGQLHSQPPTHPDTGIEVSVRSQYTPGELIGLAEKHGLIVNNIYPVHFHAMPPKIIKGYGELHSEVAQKQSGQGFNEYSMVPQSSTFVIDFRKA